MCLSLHVYVHAYMKMEAAFLSVDTEEESTY